jgi:peptide chain release factor subunit 1
MLSREELKELAKMHGNGSYFVSLYLNVNPLTNPKGEYSIRLKNMLRDAAESLEKGVLKKVEKDLEALEAYVLGNRREFKKGLALISSKESNFWREYHLSVPLRSELTVEKSPYIKPLLDILDNYQRYAALLVDKESARIFIIHLGEITEYGEVHTPDVPGRHKKGGWYALSQNHYVRHIEHHVALHLKDVIKKFESFLKHEYIGRVIIGGSEEAVNMTKERLPNTVMEKVVGTFNAGMFEGNADVMKKVEPALREYEIRQEEKAVKELFTRAMKDEKAVVGLEDVLKALEGGRVMKLLLLRDFTRQGFQCSACGALSIKGEVNCPYCGGKMEGVGYMVDLAAQKAVEQGSLVEVVTGSEELEKAGGIGAFLRF